MMYQDKTMEIMEAVTSFLTIHEILKNLILASGIFIKIFFEI